MSDARFQRMGLAKSRMDCITMPMYRGDAPSCTVSVRKTDRARSPLRPRGFPAVTILSPSRIW